jgi:hypothetical protein
MNKNVLAISQKHEDPRPHYGHTRVGSIYFEVKGDKSKGFFFSFFIFKY